METNKIIGKHTVRLPSLPVVKGFASVVGKKEGQGPLRSSFDLINEDTSFGEKTWEKAEAKMQSEAFRIASEKSGVSPLQIERMFAGDLLNQCVGSSLASRESGIPYFGLYGACSTMAEGLSLAAMAIDGGFASYTAAITSSHFCSAERQYRMPLEYGGQRTPTAQWTCTASGCVILGTQGNGPVIQSITTGQIVDAGICDANNMGAAMAPAAYSTLSNLFTETSTSPQDYDLIVTGDLGSVGARILRDLFSGEGVELGEVYNDCGILMFSPSQDVHAGGSGCGCSAAVLCGHILEGMMNGRWRKTVFAGTGALHSPTSVAQGESIPGICHAVVICSEKETSR